MGYTLEEIATAIGGKAVGDTSLRMRATAEPASAASDELALASTAKYASALTGGQARAALLWMDADWASLGLEGAILAPRPKFAMAALTAKFDATWRTAHGIHPSAVIDPSAVIGDDAAIGPFVTIAADVVIGAGARIAGHCSIGPGTTIGKDATLFEGVRIQHGAEIGDRFVAMPGAVIGSDGFSFVTAEPSVAETARQSLGDDVQGAGQPWTRVHSLGTVVIGDDVEVGTNTCIDRGTIRATQIGHRTKIDNLVQVGHNVIIGEDSLICGKAGIAGSAVLGRHVVLGGDASIADNIVIGDGVVAALCAKVISNVPAGRMIMGYPAVQMKSHLDMYKATRRLPKALQDLAELKKAVLNRPQSD